MKKIFCRLAVSILALTAFSSGGFAAGSELSPKEIYKLYSPGVVLIMGLESDGSGELGTGSLVDAKGKVLTNAHVVIRASTGKPYETIRVYLKPAKISGDPQTDLVNPIGAKVASYDRALDLAILELESAPSNPTVVPFRDSAEVDSGEPVVAIGHPEQGGLWTLTQGVVSTVISNLGGVKGKNVFQTDASINRGNSGGPLLSRRGGLIGVNTSMARKAPDGLTITSVNFAVKSEVVKGWLARSGEKVDFTQVAGNPEPAQTKPAESPREIPKEPVRETVKETPKEKPREIPKEAPNDKPRETPKETPREAPKAEILTPKKPFKIQDLIAREIAEMEDLEEEMKGEVRKRTGAGAP